MTAFLTMDGYGVWVWSCYALAAAAVGGLLAMVLSERARARSRLARLQALAAEESFEPDDGDDLPRGTA